MVLRDCRFKQYNDSLLGTVESSLCAGPVYFNCYPNFPVSLQEKNILKALTLQIQTHNYHMEEGSYPITIIYKIC